MNMKIASCKLCCWRCLTPADAALMIQLGAEGRLCRFRYFQVRSPVKRASAIVKSCDQLPKSSNPWLQISEDLGEAMVGNNENEIQILMAEQENR